MGNSNFILSLSKGVLPCPFEEFVGFFERAKEVEEDEDDGGEGGGLSPFFPFPFGGLSPFLP